MPNKLTLNADFQEEWNAEIDGPFSWRTVTNCDEVNALLRIAVAIKRQLLNGAVTAVETVLGKLTKRRRMKLEKLLVPVIETACGQAWQMGCLAERATRSHEKSGKQNADRDAAIVEAVSREMNSPAKLGLEKACRKVALMKTTDGKKPMFSVRGNDKKPLKWESIKSVCDRSNSPRKSRSKKPHPK
jgi:hypothetical protein